MTKKATQIMLGLAVTAVIGAGAIGANSFFVSSALASDADQKTPVIAADVVSTNVNAKSAPEKTSTTPDTKTQSTSSNGAVITVDDKGNVIFDKSSTEQDKLQLKKDLERKLQASGSNPSFVAGTPSEDDLTETAAIKIAKEAIAGEYALTGETLAKFSTGAVFNVCNPGAPVWSVSFYPTDQNDFSAIGTYNVTVDAQSGKIIKILSAADGVG